FGRDSEPTTDNYSLSLHDALPIFTTQGNEQVLVAHRCGAGQSPAMVSSFVVQAPLSVSPDGQRIVLACDTGDIDQTAGEGGSAQMVSCGSTLLELQLAPEGTCTLVLD